MLNCEKDEWNFMYVFTKPLCHGQDMIQGQFLRATVSLNTEIFFFLDCLIKVKETSLLYYLPIAGERKDGFLPFSKIINTK